MENFRDILGQAETKGDVALLLAAGASGFVIDAGLDVVGFMAPSAVSVVSAAGVLAVKKGWDAHRDRVKNRKYAAAAEARVAETVQRAEKLQKFFLDQSYGRGYAALETNLDWRRAGIIDDQQLESACDDLRKEFFAFHSARIEGPDY
jgi:hypothetical protein